MVSTLAVYAEAAETAIAHRAAVERVIREMTDQIDGDLPLSAMAAIACLSPFHFSRVFRSLTGVPPGAFLTALRMDQAKRILLTTNLSITDVCFEVGYTSLGTFTSRFTQLVGITPSHLRRLSEDVEAVLNRVGESDRLRWQPAAVGLSGQVISPGLIDALIFIGLFAQGMAQREPIAGTLLDAPGVYQLAAVPDGRYSLLCAAVPMRPDPVAWLAPGSDVRVGGGQEIVVRHGHIYGDPKIALRPRRLTDPPILVAPLHLLLQSLPTCERRDRRSG